MKSIREIAQKATTLSNVTEGNTKISNEEIIDHLDGRIAIDEIDRISAKGIDGKISDTYVYHIAKTKYFAFAGFVLSKVFDQILEEYEGDYTEVNLQLQAEPLEIKMTSGTTRGGRRIALIEVL